MFEFGGVIAFSVVENDFPDFQGSFLAQRPMRLVPRIWMEGLAKRRAAAVSMSPLVASMLSFMSFFAAEKLHLLHLFSERTRLAATR